MPYCGQDELSALLGASTLQDLLGGAPHDWEYRPVLEAVCVAASEEVDAYLSVRMPVPLGLPVPPLVVNLAARLAAHSLYRRLGQVPEDWGKDRAAALALLERIAAGKLGIGGSGPAPLGAGAGVAKAAAPVLRLDDLETLF